MEAHPTANSADQSSARRQAPGKVVRTVASRLNLRASCLASDWGLVPIERVVRHLILPNGNAGAREGRHGIAGAGSRRNVVRALYTISDMKADAEVADPSPSRPSS